MNEKAPSSGVAVDQDALVRAFKDAKLIGCGMGCGVRRKPSLREAKDMAEVVLAEIEHQRGEQS